MIRCRQDVLPCDLTFADDTAETLHRTPIRPATGPWLHGCHNPVFDGSVADTAGCWHNTEKQEAA